MEGTMAKAEMVAGRVRPMLGKGITPKQIGEEVTKMFPRKTLNFAVLRRVDEILCNRAGGGFWMSAFNYPKVGDVVRAPEWGGVIRVTSVGIFTFEGDVLGENHEDDLDWWEDHRPM